MKDSKQALLSKSHRLLGAYIQFRLLFSHQEPGRHWALDKPRVAFKLHSQPCSKRSCWDRTGPRHILLEVKDKTVSLLVHVNHLTVLEILPQQWWWGTSSIIPEWIKFVQGARNRSHGVHNSLLFLSASAAWGICLTPLNGRTGSALGTEINLNYLLKLSVAKYSN